MPYYNYNNPNPYNSNLSYDGFYLNASVSGNTAGATGITNNVFVRISEGLVVNTSRATGITYTPTIFTPIRVERVRLYNGYPRPQDVALVRNRKVTVVGGKLGYQLTGKFWTTKL